MHRLLSCFLDQQAFVSLRSYETKKVLGVLLRSRKSRHLQHFIQAKTLLGVTDGDATSKLNHTMLNLELLVRDSTSSEGGSSCDNALFNREKKTIKMSEHTSGTVDFGVATRVCIAKLFTTLDTALFKLRKMEPNNFASAADMRSIGSLDTTIIATSLSALQCTFSFLLLLLLYFDDYDKY